MDGPCDDTCGCAAPTATGETLRPGTAIACSLGADEIDTRVDEWRTLLRLAGRRQPIPGGLRVSFPSATALTEITRLVAAEHDCCAFFAFAITVDTRGIALEVTAPDEAQSLLESLVGAPD